MGHSGRLAEMCVRLAGGPLALHQYGVLASGRTQSQLIESDHLTTALHDSLSRLVGYAKGAHLDVGHVQQTNVVGHGSHNDRNAVHLLALLHEAHDSLQRDRRSVHATHKQTTQNDAVKLSLCATVQEPVQLKEDGKKIRNWLPLHSDHFHCLITESPISQRNIFC